MASVLHKKAVYLLTFMLTSAIDSPSLIPVGNVERRGGLLLVGPGADEMKSEAAESKDPIEEELEVPNELANRMSLFYAHATPMLKVLSDATTRFVAENKDLPIENTTETLGTMAKVCQRMVENPEFYSRFKNEETVLFVLRVMVGVIILYDHVHPVGAFAKSSHIDVCIKSW
ncbi:protein FAM49B-like [Centruroides sculpturatus]|uniref:protein FAM49B-like n=1 Tax=Centruroides sculpturatus TaxID=218467 RepID=UPI000C6DE694|nr:protein FAM49B-like [Centruroides sculpturatus]